MTTITIPRETFDQMREALEKIAQSAFNARSIAEHAVAIANVATANQERTESILIDGKEYTVPAPVAAEILRLHLENRGAIQERDAIYDLMDSKRKCMEELRGALAYHMEQTRPIQRSIEALSAAKAVQPQAQGEAERLYDAIEDCLLNYRLHGFVQDDGDSYPLVDHLSHGDSIEDGQHEIRLICDSIYNTVLKPAHPQASEPEWNDENVIAYCIKRGIRAAAPEAIK
jgi:hypothetical protein